ncbi:hypothetical protein NDU88_001406 [Pleurodeles waltl]|uniref:Uncharacterized protein n=1 Tax=Pleurodeles waltl TaxID=8319 RepID=A0AAV7U6T1_PLEWA|nr:hypothetical protein NDU88_001406 [Pleurodeles waltl]
MIQAAVHKRLCLLFSSGRPELPALIGQTLQWIRESRSSLTPARAAPSRLPAHAPPHPKQQLRKVGAPGAAVKWGAVQGIRPPRGRADEPRGPAGAGVLRSGLGADTPSSSSPRERLAADGGASLPSGQPARPLRIQLCSLPLDRRSQDAGCTSAVDLSCLYWVRRVVFALGLSYGLCFLSIAAPRTLWNFVLPGISGPDSSRTPLDPSCDC